MAIGTLLTRTWIGVVSFLIYTKLAFASTLRRIEVVKYHTSTTHQINYQHKQASVPQKLQLVQIDKIVNFHIQKGDNCVELWYASFIYNYNRDIS